MLIGLQHGLIISLSKVFMNFEYVTVGVNGFQYGSNRVLMDFNMVLMDCNMVLMGS